MRTESVCLRALNPEDLERTLKWHNDPELYASLGGPFRFVSRAAEEEWLRRRCGYGADEVSLAICRAKTGAHIGNIYLRNLDWVSRRAETHMFIGEAAQRGKGYGASALRQLIAHAFQTMGLRRLYLHVLADNAAAIGLYEHCGFKAEGRLKRHAFKLGRYQDVLVMGLCAPAAAPRAVRRRRRA